MQQGQMLAGFAALRARRAQGAPPKKKGKKKFAPAQSQSRPPLGSGQRFDQLSSQLAQKPGVTNPGGLAAQIGRAKLGKSRFQGLAARGKPGY